MKYALTYLKDKECFLIEDYGKTDPNVIEEALKEILQSEHWRNPGNIIFDCSNEDLSQLNTSDVQIISLKFTLYNKVLAGSRFAIVMPKDLSFGMGRMWEAFTINKATFQIQIFRTLDAAHNWLKNKN